MSVVEGRVSGAGEERIEFEEVPGADAVMVNDFDAVYIGYEVSVPPERELEPGELHAFLTERENTHFTMYVHPDPLKEYVACIERPTPPEQFAWKRVPSVMEQRVKKVQRMSLDNAGLLSRPISSERLRELSEDAFYDGGVDGEEETETVDV